MRVQLLLPQLLVDVFHLERLHFLCIQTKIDRVAILLQPTCLVVDPLVVRPELRCFEEEAERRSFRNVNAFWAC